QQKTSPTIATIVAQEQIQRFPDRNAAEAVQRLPGVSVQREEGEGELVQIRGLGAELNAVTINGQRAPSANPRFGESTANARSTSLETIQADIVQAIRVNKALSPDLDGDAIGGQIDFQLATAPTRGRAEFEFGVGQNRPPELQSIYTNQLGNGRATLGRRFFGDRVGVLLNGSYLRNQRGTVSWTDFFVSDNGSATDTVLNRRRSEDRDLARERLGLVGSFDVRFSPDHSMRLATTGNWYDSDEIRRRADFRTTDNGRNDHFLRNQVEARRLATVDLAGDHRLGRGRLEYIVGYGQGEERQPDRTIYNFRRTAGELRTATNSFLRSLDATRDFVSTPVYNLRFVERIPFFHREETRQGRADYSFPIRTAGGEQVIKFGAKALQRDKVFDSRYFQHAPLTASSVQMAGSNPSRFDDVTFLNEQYRAFGLRRTATGTDSLVEDKRRGLYTNYDVDELISAGYAMGTFNRGTQWTLVAGARLENTSFTMFTTAPGATATAPDVRVRTRTTYSNILPSAHLTYRPTQNSNVRLAYSSGLARPDYFPLVDSRFQNEDGDSIVGNPTLRPTTARNVDLMFERYTGDLGLLQIGGFAKFLRNPIARTREVYNVATGDERITSINGNAATIYGIEGALSYRFARLPDALRVLRPFGVYATYSYARTTASYDIGAVNRELPFLNTPRHTGNVALTYDDRGAGLQFTATLNYRSDRLDEIGSDAARDIWYREETQLDISGAKQLQGPVEAFVRLNNLLDTPERRTIGQPGSATARARFYETYGRSLLFGFRYTY
ncbi:MAG: TonB-dependent receptor, partial [Gemmatimonadaceae bacterium]|nr:TonB-dependent receptor [Gemmatimonadaceae bacterium]